MIHLPCPGAPSATHMGHWHLFKPGQVASGSAGQQQGDEGSGEHLTTPLLGPPTVPRTMLSA